MTRYYKEYDHHLVALDCIIFGFDEGELKLLLLKRKFEPAKGEWSLMGGFLSKSESLDEAACRILNQLTGLTNIYMKQLNAFGDVARDPGARTISVAYYALIKIDENDRLLAEAHGAEWISISKLPVLIFDHSVMVDKALEALRRRTSREPIGFELLPVKFTLPQLQSLYESICGEQLDKRNFRKQILETGLLVKLEEKDKESSKKGAFLYKFDHKKYNSYVDKGFLFQLKVKSGQIIKENSGILLDKAE
jgi:ADP-ribose pyrophosphatase YjhB (NUDIX family)